MSQSKWLFICARHPETTKVFGGGEALTASNLAALRSLAHVEVVSLLNREGWLEKVMRLAFLFFGYTSSLYPWKVRQIKRLQRRHDFKGVFIDQSFYGRLAKDLKAQNTDLKVIVSFHNNESQAALTNLPVPHFLRKAIAKVAAYNETLAMSYSDISLFLTHEDLIAVTANKTKNATNLFVLPAILPPSEKSPAKILKFEKEYLLFCGSYFPPNIQGLEWFIGNVLPHIPYDLHIAGFNMEKWSTVNSRVKNWGTVPNLTPHYAAASGVIAPIFVGGGMKIKTVEALDYGKKIFATSHALRGLEDKNLCALDSAEEFISAILEFKKSPTTKWVIENKFDSKKQFFAKLID